MSFPQLRSQWLTKKPGVHLPASLRALRHPNYRLWFFGQGVSLVGTWMQTMAQQVLIYRLTGSAAALGIANLMTVLPLVPFALWGGSLSDRVPKQRLILITQTAMLTQALILGILAWTEVVQVWHVYIMCFLLGAAKALDIPPRQAFVIDMVEGKDDLINAIGLNSAIMNGGRLLGPALAGLAVAAIGEAMAFFLNALSFVAVIIALFLMRDLPPSSNQNRPSPGLVADTIEGVRFVLKERTLLVLLSMIGVSSFLSMPYNTLMPIFANDVLKESAAPIVTFLCGGDRPLIKCQAPEALPLGILLTTLGLGAIVGSVLVASLPERIQRGKILTVGNLAFPLFLLAFAASRSMALSTAMIILVGISFVLQNVVAITLLQVSSPDRLRSRVIALYSVVFQGMTNIGGLQAGIVADWVGAPISVGIGAAVSLLYGMWIAIRYPKVRELG
jgi:MFS family permease